MKVTGPRLLIATAILGGVFIGVAIIGSAMGFVHVRVGLEPQRHDTIDGTARYLVFRQTIDLAADGSMRLNGRATSVETLEANLGHAFKRAGAPANRSKQPVILWAESETSEKDIDTFKSKLEGYGWTDVELAIAAKIK